MNSRVYKRSIPFILAILIGILFGYENPSYDYYKYQHGRSVEINYEDYQLIKTENGSNAKDGYGYPPYTTHIASVPKFNVNSSLLYGSITLLITFMVLRLVESVESNLSRE